LFFYSGNDGSNRKVEEGSHILAIIFFKKEKNQSTGRREEHVMLSPVQLEATIRNAELRIGIARSPKFDIGRLSRTRK
jgi:hypothetical protein